MATSYVWDTSDDYAWVDNYLASLDNMSDDDLYYNIFTDGWNTKNAITDYFDQRSAQLAKKDLTSKQRRELQAELDAIKAKALSKFNDVYTTRTANYNPNQLPAEQTGGSLEEANKSNEAVGNNVQDETGNSALADMQKAIQTGLQQQQNQAQDTAKNAAAAGVSKSQAGTLSDQATQQQQTQNVGAMYAANNSQRASTQADYLEKMQEVANLEQQAKWAKQAESSSILSGLLQGGATGLGLGATIFGAVGAASGGGGAGAAATTATDTSDERMKKAPEAPRACNKERECPRGMLNDSIDEKEMRKMIKQFKDLYTRVKKLKEAR